MSGRTGQGAHAAYPRLALDQVVQAVMRYGPVRNLGLNETAYEAARADVSIRTIASPPIHDLTDPLQARAQSSVAVSLAIQLQ